MAIQPAELLHKEYRNTSIPACNVQSSPLQSSQTETSTLCFTVSQSLVHVTCIYCDYNKKKEHQWKHRDPIMPTLICSFKSCMCNTGTLRKYIVKTGVSKTTCLYLKLCASWMLGWVGCQECDQMIYSQSRTQKKQTAEERIINLFWLNAKAFTHRTLCRLFSVKSNISSISGTALYLLLYYYI